jgi:glutaredoxin-related protein
LEQALKIKKDIKVEEITEQTATIYETLGEVELEYRNFSQAYANLQKSIDIRMKLPNFGDKKNSLKINILLDYIYQSLDKENDKKAKSRTNVNNNWGKDEKDIDDLLNYIKVGHEETVAGAKSREERRTRLKNDLDIEEMEKFFLFMTKLSSLQIQMLNSTQGDIEKNLKMPIFFSAEFKNLLSHSQRLEVCNLKIMSLRRNKILKNPRGKIEVENLNYDALHSKNSQNNLSSIKNYFLVSKIMKNWETTKKYAFTGVNARQSRISRINSIKTGDGPIKRFNSRIEPKEEPFERKESDISPPEEKKTPEINVVDIIQKEGII